MKHRQAMCLSSAMRRTKRPPICSAPTRLCGSFRSRHCARDTLLEIAGGGFAREDCTEHEALRLCEGRDVPVIPWLTSTCDCGAFPCRAYGRARADLPGNWSSC